MLIASYPRSGNTFLRNVLFEVYGIESKTYHTEAHGADEGWEMAGAVKTHELPINLPKSLGDRKCVYLIRDGRDCIVSLAHHRKDVFDSESHLEQNLLEAINADEGSFFGGWSSHVLSWVNRADIVIHFEDLIANPIIECERLRSIIDLPQPNIERLPDFKTLKNGRAEYGSGKYVSEKNLAMDWFRSGKVNGWKNELPLWLSDRFWHLHGECMEYIGYHFNGEPLVSRLTDNHFETSTKSIIIEASKVTDVFTDGIKRYTIEMLRAARDYPVKNLDISVLVNGSLLSIEETLETIDGYQDKKRAFAFSLVKNLAQLVLPKRLYQSLAKSPLVLRLKNGSIPENRSNSMSLVADLVHLSLPQHFQFVENIESSQWVGTIHDMTHEKNADMHTVRNVELATHGMAFLRKKNARFIAVSERTKMDLSEKEIKSSRIYEGVNRKQFFPVINPHWIDLVHERYDIPKKQFLLSVCTLEPRKNLKSLIAAYAQLSVEQRSKHPMVLAGRKGWEWDGDIVPTHCKHNVHFVGFVEEAHLASMYSAAYAFCYVSQYEGFGLPVLEAMACGCPVVASSNTSLAEVVGHAGVLVDPHSVESIQLGLESMLDPVINEKWSKTALHRSWEFTWRKSWEKTAALYLA